MVREFYIEELCNQFASFLKEEIIYLIRNSVTNVWKDTLGNIFVFDPIITSIFGLK